MRSTAKTSAYDTPLTDAEMKAPIRTLDLWFRRAKAFKELTNPTGKWPTIVPGSQDWHEWREYFERHLGRVPVAMQKIIDNAPDRPPSFTVPAPFPQHFDQTFRADPNWRPAPVKEPLPRNLRPALQAMPRFDHPFTPKVNPGLEPPAKYQSLTDADLRRLYSKPDPLAEG